MDSATFISKSTTFSNDLGDLAKGLEGHCGVFSDHIKKWSLQTAEGASDLLVSDLKLLNAAIKDAEVFKKSLDEKIKSKERLNFFKTQKNLDGVKTAGDKLTSSIKSGRAAAGTYEGKSKSLITQLTEAQTAVNLEKTVLPKVTKAVDGLKGEGDKCIQYGKQFEASVTDAQKKFDAYDDLGELKTAVDKVARTASAFEALLNATGRKRDELSKALQEGKAATTPKAVAELATASKALTEVNEDMKKAGSLTNAERAPDMYRGKLGVRQRLYENEAVLTRELEQAIENSVDARNHLDAEVHDLEELEGGFKAAVGKGNAAQTESAKAKLKQKLKDTIGSMQTTGAAKAALATAVNNSKSVQLPDSKQALINAAKEVPIIKQSFDLANKLAVKVAPTVNG